MAKELIQRRIFMGSLLMPVLAAFRSRAALAAPPMKITKIETVYWKNYQDAPWRPNWTWIKSTLMPGLRALEKPIREAKRKRR